MIRPRDSNFDFTGRSETEYVLDTIEIRTIDFEEYRGGGFFNNEAWYDILLRHTLGIHVYDVDRRLRFTGSGRAVLRFWSDNWYPNVGMAPQGCYFIDITFVFRVNGNIERVTRCIQDRRIVYWLTRNFSKIGPC